MIGKKITRRELQARWAYNEVASKRFAHDRVQFQSKEMESLFDKAKREVPFEDLLAEDIDCLLDMHEDNFRSVPRGDILESIHDVEKFVCESWSKERLLETVLPPKFGGGLFLDYVIRETAPNMSNDPRTAAARKVPVEPFVQGEPLCIVPYKGNLLLLEGALRGLMFMAATKPTKKEEILVWVPVENAQQHAKHKAHKTAKHKTEGHKTRPAERH